MEMNLDRSEVAACYCYYCAGIFISLRLPFGCMTIYCCCAKLDRSGLLPEEPAFGGIPLLGRGGPPLILALRGA